MSLNTVGARVRQRRKELGWSQTDLAAKLQVEGLPEISQVTISKFEHGIRKVYDYEVQALARVLDVSADWLLNSGDSRK